jgi:AmmeMemoRadiSam system protein B
LQSLAPEVVFVLAPSHHASFSHPSIWDGPAYATPLGDYPIHPEIAERLRQTLPGIRCETWAERQEHALEVQIPFLQVACPNAQMVPLLLGSCTSQNTDEVADGIEQVLRQENLTERGRVALVASSDGYHGYHLRECQASDAHLAKAIEQMDRQALYGSTPSGDPMACGRGPISVVIEISRRLGATRGVILNQTNSADAVPHSDGQWVVGYLSAMFV